MKKLVLLTFIFLFSAGIAYIQPDYDQGTQSAFQGNAAIQTSFDRAHTKGKGLDKRESTR